MNYREVKQKLKKEYTQLLKPLGFKGKSDSQGCEFSLVNKDSTCAIGYGIVNYIDEFKTGCFLGIGMHKIQNIEKNIFDGSFYDTLSLGITNYFNVVNYDFTIKTDDDITEWMKIVSKFYFEFAEPFFNKYNSVADIDTLLNTNPKERVPELDDLGGHIMKGLISAKLNNNPNYRELREYYKNEVEDKFKGHFLYDNCMKVIDFLDVHSTEELNSMSETSAV